LVLAANSEEQGCMILIMLIGAIVFARLIADVHAICANLSRLADKKEAVLGPVRV
jgi:hypothetical protein